MDDYDLAEMARARGVRGQQPLPPVAVPPGGGELEVALRNYVQAASRFAKGKALKDRDADELREFLLRAKPGLTSVIEREMRAREREHAAKFAASVKSATGVDVGRHLKPTDVEAEREQMRRDMEDRIYMMSEDIAERFDRVVSREETEKKRSDEEALDDEMEKIEKRAAFMARHFRAVWHGRINRTRHVQAGIGYYRWITTLDGRQRETHDANHMKVFDWSVPPDTGHPGEDYNCRCIAQPLVGEP